jgi:hypothetical protein
MNTISPDAARRGFFSRMVGAAALGVSGLVAAADARANTRLADGADWPGKLRGRHRQVVDGYQISNGGPLQYAHNFLASDPAPGASQVVLILRDGALPVALDSTIWAKYRIGEAFKIIDPETNAPAIKNPFLHPKPGILRSDESAIDRLLAAGAVIGACDVALHAQSRKLAHNAGVSAEDAAKEWAANVVPGVTVIRSGVWGVNRAQEAGCTYCSGG